MDGKQVPRDDRGRQDAEPPDDETPPALETEGPDCQEQDVQHDDPLHPYGGYRNQDGRGRSQRPHEGADGLRRQEGLCVRRVGKGGRFGNENRVRGRKQFSDGGGIRRPQAGHDGDDHLLGVQHGGAAVFRQRNAAVFVQRNGTLAAQEKGVARNDSHVAGFQVQRVQGGRPAEGWG